MQRTLKEHIDSLEQFIRQCSDDLMQQEDVRLRNELETKIRAAETALAQYRAALKAEQSLVPCGSAKP